MADLIERRLRLGVYGSATEVIRDGLRALEDKDDALERWIRGEVLPGHADYVADPTTAVAADNPLERIKSRRGSRRT